MNKEDIIEDISQNMLAYMYAPPELKKDKDVVLAAVSKNGSILQYVPSELRNDHQVIMAAVAQNGLALRYARGLKDDTDIFMTAIKQNGMALEYAPELKNDQYAVMTAIMNNGMALRFASPELRTDPEFLWYASKNGYVPNEVEQASIQKYDVTRKSHLIPLAAMPFKQGYYANQKLKGLVRGFAGYGGKRKTRRHKINL